MRRRLAFRSVGAAPPVRPELVLLVVLGLLTRFWRLSWPDAVVFDEALYEEYISHYFTGGFYFNLHPPVGKLILALGAWLLRVPADVLAEPAPAVALRAVPALAGALVIPVFWLMLRQLGASRPVAALGAFLLLCDHALLAVSRFILIDSILLLAMLGAVTAYLAARTRTGGARIGFTVLAAGCAGLAAGTKWTGLGALAVIGVAWLADFARAVRSRRTLAEDAAILAAVPAAVYVAAFAVHFALLPTWGREAGVMGPEFEATLRGSVTYREDAHLSLAKKLVLAHRAMREGNEAYVTSTHIGASPWWSWPILKHPLYVWNGARTADGREGHVFIEGNPVVWWTALIGMAVIGIAALRPRSRERLAAHRTTLVLLAAAWAVNFLPFAFVSRILFLYSYLPALAFSIAFTVIGGGALLEWNADGWRFGSRRAAAAYWGVAGLAFAAFLYFAPLAYGTPITDAAYQRRLWILERHVLQSD